MEYGTQTNLDRPVCPKGHGQMVKQKEWILRGKHDNAIIIELFKCSQCGTTTRITHKTMRARAHKGERKH